MQLPQHRGDRRLRHLLVAGAKFTDIKGESSPGDASAEILRRGAEPTVARIAHDRSLIAQVQTLRRSGCLTGDIGILAPHTYGTGDIRRALDLAAILSFDFLHYRGLVDEKVKVARSSGLRYSSSSR